MQDMHIICPKQAHNIGHIYLNGVDCGSAVGVTRLIFEVTPNGPPELIVERIPASLPRDEDR